MTTIATNALDADRADSREQQKLFVEKKCVLRIRELRKAFGGQVVLDGVSAELHEGEVVLLRGDNGSGKTTLLNILSGNLEPDAGSIHLQINSTTEHFEFPRQWWQNLNPFDHFTPERVAREGVGRTWQDVRLFGTMTLTENIAVASAHQLGENPLNVLFRRNATHCKERMNLQTASNRLAGLGLNGRDHSSADRISLGQTKRVAIARAIQAGARILFLDEPLAGLDSHGIKDVLDLLRALVKEHQVTLVIVEHVFNIPRILGLADTVWTLRNGKISIESPALIREQHAKSFDTDIVSWITKQLGQESTVSQELLPQGAVLWKSRHPKFEIQDSAPLLEVRDLVVRRGNRLVIGQEDPAGTVQGLSFSIGHGEVAILQAPNGWGKTTLFDALAGNTSIGSGVVRLDGTSITRMPPWQRVQQGLGYLRATYNTFFQLHVRESLRLTGSPNHSDLIPKVLLPRLVSSLSGGEKQKLAISCHPRFAKCHLLDEPFSALDAASLAGSQIFTALRLDISSGMLIALPSTTEHKTSGTHDIKI
jgi:ABC-type branched-subunit amino acid transport system ATPase component